MMLMLSLDDAVNVTRRLVQEEMDDVTIIRQELEQKCWFPPETDEAARELSNRIFDISPAMICEQIKTGNLKNWCVVMQTHMKMAMVQLPCWAEQWVPCSERLPEEAYPVIVTWTNEDPASYYQYILGKHYVGVAHYKNGKWFWYSSTTEDVLREYGRCDYEEFDEAIKTIAWMPLPEPYEPEE